MSQEDINERLNRIEERLQETGAIVVLASPVLDLNSAAIQTGFTVPDDQVCIVSGLLLRSADVDVSDTAGDLALTIAWDLDATPVPLFSDNSGITNAVMILLTGPAKTVGRSVLLPRNESGEGPAVNSDLIQCNAGLAGQKLQFQLNELFGDPGSVTIDILGYYADAVI